MKLLAIDTATEACSVALLLDGAIHERFELAGRTHSQRLPAMFAALLAEAGIVPTQLDGIVAGVGPGSFAGVRIGVAFVKGLALGVDRPVVGISSLAMLAQSAIEAGATTALAAIDARMDQIYVGAYREELGLARLAGDESVITPTDWIAPALLASMQSGPIAAVGSGWAAYGEALLARLPSAPSIVDSAALPHAAAALKLGQPEFAAGRAVDASRLVPNYLRNRVALTQVEQIEARQAKKL